MTSFPRLSIVLSTHAAQFEAVAYKGEFEANLAKIAGFGYDGVELAIRDPSLVEAGELGRMLTKYNLAMPAIGTGQAWSEEGLSFINNDPTVRKAAIERVKQHIILAQHFKALVIIGLIRGNTPPGQSKEKSIQFLRDSLLECTEAASNHQVRLALEPLNRYETDLIHTVQEGLELIEQISSPNLGLLLDTFHMNIEEANIEGSILQAGACIFHFHVADSNRWFPGGGHLDFRSILQALKSTGYQGWISGEFMPNPEADIAARTAITTMKEIVLDLYSRS